MQPRGRVDRVRVVGRLLDLDDDAVAHERELAAAAGAVGRAGRAHDPVDRQAGRRRRSRAPALAAGGSRTGRTVPAAAPAAAPAAPLRKRAAIEVHRQITGLAAGQRGSSIVWSRAPHSAQRVALVPWAGGRTALTARAPSPLAKRAPRSAAQGDRDGGGGGQEPAPRQVRAWIHREAVSGGTRNL